MLTRRTLLRTFLLRPDPEVGQIYLYLFAVLAKKYEIRAHSLAVLSTHKHDMVTDVLGQRPKFLAELHRVVAPCIKHLRKWDGTVWGVSSYRPVVGQRRLWPKYCDRLGRWRLLHFGRTAGPA